ncbi:MULTISPECIES: GNAT family N-acetyltransferase [unclassified Yoonia]|uniref:GNAT family N-acetyltransferase n=1 Tax=unclassified Yoonia TaxID=2629118 RepID=UPI002AFF961B|nr:MULTISPECIES: GNAT family N-acetyltransferase [unclassified Yoonia]
MTNVTIAPMTPATQNALREISVTPEQVNFSGQPTEVIDLDEPLIDIHVIHYGDQVAGMFRIDRGFHLHHRFAASTTYGLRTFLVDHRLQGRGIARECCGQLHRYLSARYPAAEAIMLTVNLLNPGARKVYLAGGFIDTGAQYMDGGFGPQHILKLPL